MASHEDDPRGVKGLQERDNKLHDVQTQEKNTTALDRTTSWVIDSTDTDAGGFDYVMDRKNTAAQMAKNTRLELQTAQEFATDILRDLPGIPSRTAIQIETTNWIDACKSLQNLLMIYVSTKWLLLTNISLHVLKRSL